MNSKWSVGNPYGNHTKLSNKMVLKCSKDSKTVLKILIRPMVHDLWDSPIYINTHCTLCFAHYEKNLSVLRCFHFDESYASLGHNGKKMVFTHRR